MAYGRVRSEGAEVCVSPCFSVVVAGTLDPRGRGRGRPAAALVEDAPGDLYRIGRAFPGLRPPDGRPGRRTGAVVGQLVGVVFTHGDKGRQEVVTMLREPG